MSHRQQTHRFQGVADVGLDEALLKLVLHEHKTATKPRLKRYWTYYRNPAEPVGRGGGGVSGGGAARRYRLGQEQGLPDRLIGSNDSEADDRARARREIVIENDIAWRIHTMVDFMFGKPVTILSTAPDEDKRRMIEKLLDAVWEASGGIALLQDMALLGHIYGHVDLLVRVDERLASIEPGTMDQDRLLDLAKLIRIEVIEPMRGIPLLNSSDYRNLDAYIIHFDQQLNEVQPGNSLRRAFSGVPGINARWRTSSTTNQQRKTRTITQILTPEARLLFEDGELVEHTPNEVQPGQLPIVHIQNISQPFRYEGLGEVEPLIPLQDELNTRLSDRASRVTMQSFKMYLVKGIDGAGRFSVGPGQLWSTDNPDASIEAFGGDSHSPSEEAHIEQIREAMDKVSAVPPLASGVVRAKIGNLSSANALKITLMGIISKTARKRVTYGRGMAQVSKFVLAAFDNAGVFETTTQERDVRIQWPDPLPEDVREQVFAAQAKRDLGVPQDRILAELGYAPTDPGLT